MTKKKQKDDSQTPLMRQYFDIKRQHPDAMLLFRVGDFFELFGEDAVKSSEILGITLTKRANGAASEVELAGFPHHSLDLYLPKLIRSGQRVAICEQMEDPSQAKKLVKRGVTELVTPGTSLDEKLLDNRENNFLAAVHFDNENTGVAFLDLSTGEFFVTEGDRDYAQKLLQSLAPSEVLFSKAAGEEYREHFGDRFYTFQMDDWLFEHDFAREKLLNHFQTSNLKGFGIENLKSGIIAAGAIMHYLTENKHTKLSHISGITRLEPEQYVWLDRFTLKNLEITEPASSEGETLLDVLDSTKSPMGSRLLRKWLVLPLKEIKPIKERLSIVDYFVHNREHAEALRDEVNKVGDLERLISKAALQRINPREVNQVKRALHIVEAIKSQLNKTENDHLLKIEEQLNPCISIREKIEKELVEDPPVNTQKGGLINEGVSDELDENRKMAHSGKDYLLELQQKEINNTGISSLKVGFNNVFGYYLEVKNTHKEKVPQEWIRKQTLVSAERYITEELKELEEKILTAEERTYALEQQVFQELVYRLSDYIQPIQQNANLIARLDCLLSFAETAVRNNFVRPLPEDSLTLDIKQGRHPVIEQTLPPEESYVPNDVYLDNLSRQMVILTGPNMSGKSAILRQTALIVLMTQIGSFVPASEARVGLIDKIFTRVGASDNLSQGESTFMVEMTETASILNNISPRSLVLLDEIGRGTSTYDGVSIAWAICEYLHEAESRPKTLFATHYHELNELENQLERVKNFHVSVKEKDGKILFLRTLMEGGSEHSFGIHVAQMAGMPRPVVNRADELLDQLENRDEGRKKLSSAPNDNGGGVQLKLFEYEDPVGKELQQKLKELDVNSLTPVEALLKLNELKEIKEKKKQNSQ